MKKLINKPEDFVRETMEGIIAAYGDKVRLLDNDYRILLSSYGAREGKVGMSRQAVPGTCRYSWAMWARGFWTGAPSEMYLPPRQHQKWRI